MSMHILVTNDDGVSSPGLLALKQALEPLGDVSVIAPDRNRSAIARGITIHNALWVEEVELADGSRAYATDGTPVDCVRLAALGLLEAVPNVIVSGINLGLNLGDDVTYSGTVAAALEGVLLGLPSVAVSQEPCGPSLDLTGEEYPYDFRAVASFVSRLVPLTCREDFPRKVLMSVNAPGRAPEEMAGARVTRLGRRIYNDVLRLESEEGGRRRYRMYGAEASHHPEEGTDFDAIEQGEISVTPLHFDLTDVSGMDALERLELGRLLEREAAPANRR
jgi:5'-nucleotidase